MPSCARLDGRGRPSLRVHGRGWRPSPPRPQVLQHCGRVGFEIAELRSAGRARAPVPTCSRKRLETRPHPGLEFFNIADELIEIAELRSAGRARAPVPTCSRERLETRPRPASSACRTRGASVLRFAQDDKLLAKRLAQDDKLLASELAQNDQSLARASLLMMASPQRVTGQRTFNG